MCNQTIIHLITLMPLPHNYVNLLISRIEIKEVQKQKTDEMIEKFKARKGLDLGNGRSIQIGG